MKQIGLAMLQYAQDYDETAPMQGALAAAANPGDQHFWSATMWALFPYVKSSGVYRCPDDQTTWGSSYLVNNNLYGPMSIYDSPASSVAFVDGMVYGQPDAWYPNHPGDFDYGLNGDYTVFCAAGRLQARHVGNSIANLLFADGHVKNSRPIAYGTANATSPAAQLTAKAASLNAILPFAGPLSGLANKRQRHNVYGSHDLPSHGYQSDQLPNHRRLVRRRVDGKVLKDFLAFGNMCAEGRPERRNS